MEFKQIKLLHQRNLDRKNGAERLFRIAINSLQESLADVLRVASLPRDLYFRKSDEVNAGLFEEISGMVGHAYNDKNVYVHSELLCSLVLPLLENGENFYQVDFTIIRERSKFMIQLSNGNIYHIDNDEGDSANIDQHKFNDVAFALINDLVEPLS